MSNTVNFWICNVQLSSAWVNLCVYLLDHILVSNGTACDCTYIKPKKL